MAGESGRIPAAVARSLGTAIVDGRLQPGAVLEGEIGAAERFAVSRAAYREGLRLLAAKGLVESRTKTGTRVTPRARWRLLDPEVLSWFLAAAEPDPRFIAALFELRQIVEPAAAAWAAERANEAEIEALRASVETMERFTFADERGRLADRTFHDTILAATRNEILVNLADGIGMAVRLTTLFKYRMTLLPRDPIPQHRRVFEAVAAREAEAAHREMAVLVREALDDIEAAIAAGPRADAPAHGNTALQDFTNGALRQDTAR